MSIASEIERLKNAKTSIASAIEEKGVDVPAETSIDEYGNYVSLIPSGNYATKEELEALSNTANAADRVKYESGVLKTLGGTEIVTGNARIATGSYVGTGTFGADNPSSLTFDFIPKVVFFTVSSLVIHSAPVYVWGSDRMTISQYGQGRYNIYVTTNGSTMTWYAEKGSLYENYAIAYQFNTSGETYHWVAIG